MEGMMKPVEIRFCTIADANLLLSGNDLWQPHGEPFFNEETKVMNVALIKMIPIRFNVRNDSNLVVPQLRAN